MQTKVCCHCKTEKPLSDFHKWSAQADGMHVECKDCRHRYWFNNQDIYRERAKYAMRRYRERKKQ